MSQKFKDTLELANELGSWTAYASYMLGVCDTGDEHLDDLLFQLYNLNEKVHLHANRTSLKHELPLFTGTMYGPQESS